MKAKIHVTLKQGILDPQGKAIEHALNRLSLRIEDSLFERDMNLGFHFFPPQ